MKPAKKAFIRFPLSIISSIVCACIGIYLVEEGNNIDNYITYVNVLLVAVLGIPAYFSVAVYSIKNPLSTRNKLFLQIGATVLLILIYLSFPSADAIHNAFSSYARYSVFNITMHLLVAFLPYLKDNNTSRFWHYNKFLFVHFLTSLLYAGLIIVGLILPVLGIKVLFNLAISNTVYADIAIGVSTIFTTWFFLANIPSKLGEVDSQKEPPTILKSILQFIVVPLLLIYILILYAYSIKIIILWDWPKGIVSYMIVIVAILGTIAYALLYPYRKDTKTVLVKLYIAYYFRMLLPLIVLLFMAIAIRIEEYGVTVNRYLIVLLGIWMSILSVFLTLKEHYIKFIPISLAVLLLIASFGPWNCFSVSENSQIERLHNILTDHHILVNDSVQNEVIWQRDKLPRLQSTLEKTNDHLLNDSAHQEVTSIIHYLDTYHGFFKIKKWFQQPIDSLLFNTSTPKYLVNEADAYLRTLGIDYRYIGTDTTYIFSSTEIDKVVIPTKGYDYFIGIFLFNDKEEISTEKDIATFDIDGYPLTIQYKNPEGRELLIITNKKDTSTISFSPLIQRKSSRKPYDVIVQCEKYVIKLEVLYAEIEKKLNSGTVRYLQGRLFVRKVI